MSVKRTPTKMNENTENSFATKSKRPHSPTTNEDIYELLIDIKKTFKEDINNLKKELGTQISEVKKDVINLKSNMGVIDKKLNAVEEKVNEATCLADQNSKIINSLLQSKLENCMEINGIEPKVIEETSDLKKLAISIITSFGIYVKDEDIDRVSKRTFATQKGNNQVIQNILIVHFNNFNKKLEILKKKNSIKETNGIYFNIALTASNRYLMMKTKQLARIKSMKTFFSGGKIRVEKLDKTEMTINDDDDLNKLQSYINNLPNNLTDMNDENMENK